QRQLVAAPRPPSSGSLLDVAHKDEADTAHEPRRREPRAESNAVPELRRHRRAESPPATTHRTAATSSSSAGDLERTRSPQTCASPVAAPPPRRWPRPRPLPRVAAAASLLPTLLLRRQPHATQQRSLQLWRTKIVSFFVT
ncbi:unnamed protein product, partial [Urochloa humidicola]